MSDLSPELAALMADGAALHAGFRDALEAMAASRGARIHALFTAWAIGQAEDGRVLVTAVVAGVGEIRVEGATREAALVELEAALPARA